MTVSPRSAGLFCECLLCCPRLIRRPACAEGACAYDCMSCPVCNYPTQYVGDRCGHSYINTDFCSGNHPVPGTTPQLMDSALEDETSGTQSCASPGTETACDAAPAFCSWENGACENTVLRTCVTQWKPEGDVGNARYYNAEVNGATQNFIWTSRRYDEFTENIRIPFGTRDGHDSIFESYDLDTATWTDRATVFGVDVATIPADTRVQLNRIVGDYGEGSCVQRTPCGCNQVDATVIDVSSYDYTHNDNDCRPKTMPSEDQYVPMSVYDGMACADSAGSFVAVHGTRTDCEAAGHTWQAANGEGRQDRVLATRTQCMAQCQYKVSNGVSADDPSCLDGANLFWVSDVTCRPHSYCNLQTQYRTSIPDSTQDTGCDTLTACSSTEYELTAPVTAVLSNTWDGGGCTAQETVNTHNRVCETMLVCGTNTVETPPPDGSTDRECTCQTGFRTDYGTAGYTGDPLLYDCTACTECVVGTTYETSACGINDDAACEPVLADCGDTQLYYETSAPSRVSDRICAEKTFCDCANEFGDIAGGGATADRTCLSLASFDQGSQYVCHAQPAAGDQTQIAAFRARYVRLEADCTTGLCTWQLDEVSIFADPRPKLAMGATSVMAGATMTDAARAIDGDSATFARGDSIATFVVLDLGSIKTFEHIDVHNSATNPVDSIDLQWSETLPSDWSTIAVQVRSRAAWNIAQHSLYSSPLTHHTTAFAVRPSHQVLG